PPIMIRVQKSPGRGEQDEDKPIELSEDAKRLARLVHEEARASPASRATEKHARPRRSGCLTAGPSWPEMRTPAPIRWIRNRHAGNSAGPGCDDAERGAHV